MEAMYILLLSTVVIGAIVILYALWLFYSKVILRRITWRTDILPEEAELVLDAYKESIGGKPKDIGKPGKRIAFDQLALNEKFHSNGLTFLVGLPMDPKRGWKGSVQGQYCMFAVEKRFIPTELVSGCYPLENKIGTVDLDGHVEWEDFTSKLLQIETIDFRVGFILVQNWDDDSVIGPLKESFGNRWKDLYREEEHLKGEVYMFEPRGFRDHVMRFMAYDEAIYAGDMFKHKLLRSTDTYYKNRNIVRQAIGLNSMSDRNE